MNANELANIWRRPIYLPYLQDPLTPEALRAAEEELGHGLPRELAMMLSVQNGGYLRYELEGYPLDAISGIGEAHPSLTHFCWGEERECVSFELDGLVPFSGDGHWYLCLDYRASEIIHAKAVKLRIGGSCAHAQNFLQPRLCAI